MQTIDKGNSCSMSPDSPTHVQTVSVASEVLSVNKDVVDNAIEENANISSALATMKVKSEISETSKSQDTLCPSSPESEGGEQGQRLSHPSFPTQSEQEQQDDAD